METLLLVAGATTFQLVLLEPVVPWRWVKVLITLFSSALMLYLLDPSMPIVRIAVAAQGMSLVAGVALLRLGQTSATPRRELRQRIPTL